VRGANGRNGEIRDVAAGGVLWADVAGLPGRRLDPLCLRLTHTRLQVATSFVAGLMLGVAVLHMVPHAWHDFESIDPVVWWLLGGFLVMFFIQRFFHFHHHDVPEEDPDHGASEPCAHTQATRNHDHEEQTLAHKSAGSFPGGAQPWPDPA